MMRAPVQQSTRISWQRSLLVGLLLSVLSACASSGAVAPPPVSERLEALVGAGIRPAPSPTNTALPPGVNTGDGVTADEAVAIALWNNAAFQVSLSELGFARADLVEAGMLTNPVLSLLFPVGPKQLEAVLKWPVEVLWQRPRRVAAARLANEATAERLVTAGLDLVLAVRIAHADLSLATDRREHVRALAAVSSQVGTLTQSRLSAGDISALEARTTEVDAARAGLDAARTDQDIAIARERLRYLLGLAAETPLSVAPEPPLPACGSTDTLLREALAARPDVRAAELAIDAAAAQLGWEKSRVVALTAVLDANGQGRDGFEMGPGLDVALPLFARNQGGRARASAGLDRASAAYVAVQHLVGLELRTATTQLEQARESIDSWQKTVMAPLAISLTDAKAARASGEVSDLFVLDYTRRATDAAIRQREFSADLRRAHARLERALGRSCSAPSQETSRDY